MGSEEEDIISDWEKNCDNVNDQDLDEEISINTYIHTYIHT